MDEDDAATISDVTQSVEDDGILTFEDNTIDFTTDVSNADGRANDEYPNDKEADEELQTNRAVSP